MTEHLQTTNILGTRIGVLDLEAATRLLGGWLGGDRHGRCVCVTGVHGVMEGLRDSRIRRLHNAADVCVPDGMPLVWVGRLRGKRRMGRVYGPDLTLRLLEFAAREGRTCFVYGGAPGRAGQFGERMMARFPGLRIVGSHTPPFQPLSPEEEASVLETVNRLAPDLLLVCLSTPKQELLMHSWRGKVNVRLMVGIGAAIDFLSGNLRQAPRWIQQAGLEWLFRLCVEPRRLAGRYLRNNPLFLLNIFMQLTGLREYPEE